MTKQGAFNTGRKYSPNGQRIGWIVVRVDIDPEFEGGMFDVSHVIFWDVDRTINGIMRVMGNVDQQSIMREYDEHRYHYASGDYSHEMRIAGELAAQA